MASSRLSATRSVISVRLEKPTFGSVKLPELLAFLKDQGLPLYAAALDEKAEDLRRSAARVLRMVRQNTVLESR